MTCHRFIASGVMCAEVGALRHQLAERRFTRAEVEALLAAQREACAQRAINYNDIRATPLVEVKP